MKQLYYTLLSLSILCTSCGKQKAVDYKVYTSQDKTYTVQIPTDFSLEYNDISGYMTFKRQSSNSSEFAVIKIEPTNNGFEEFEQTLNTNPNFLYLIYKNTRNTRFAECSKGMWSAVELAMLKELNNKKYIITLSAEVSRNSSEQIIEHIYNTMNAGEPSEISEEKTENNTKNNNFKTYSNPFLSISYPKDWKSVANPDEMSDVYLGASDESLGFTIVRFETDASLSEIVAEAKSSSEQSGMDIVSCKDITINGAKCNQMVNEFTFQGMNIKTIAYIFKKGNTMYSVKFGTQKKYVDANSNLIKKIMNTFKIK